MRIGRILLGGAIVLVLSAIVHLATVLAVPHTSPRDAWSRLSGMMADEGVTVLPAARPGEEVLPLLDPNLVYGVCRFDVGDGPFAVSARMPPAYWSIALHTERGNVFYAIDDAAAIDGTLDLELRDADSMRRYLLAHVDEAEPTLAIETPAMRGYVLMRALVSRGAKRGEVETMMRETFCGPIEDEYALPEAVSEEPARPSFPYPPDRPSGLPSGS